MAAAAGAFALAGCSTPAASVFPHPGDAVASPAPTGAAVSVRPVVATPETSLPPLRARIARLLLVGFRGFRVDESPWLRRAIEDGLGGVILFDRDGPRQGARNIESPDQVARLTADLRALAPDRELVIAIDQEGGFVTRLSPRHGFPRVASQASIGDKDDVAVGRWADGLAGTLAAAGINLNLAPVVDLNVNPDNPAIGAIDRAFSEDPAMVERAAAIEVAAHRSRGVRTTLKHFPGLGSARTNTDHGVSDVTDTWQPIELQPYRGLISAGLVDAVMAGHMVNGRIDPSAAASLSATTIVGLLRGELGWEGVVVTDDLQAAAITAVFSFEDSIALALEAGNDVLLLANQQVFDKDVVERSIDVIEGLVDDGRIGEGRIDVSVARLDRLFGMKPARA